MQGAQASGSARGAERPSWTVLVVDDNADLRELIRELLLIAGYQVVEAPDGAEALRSDDGRINSTRPSCFEHISQKPFGIC